MALELQRHFGPLASGQTPRQLVQWRWGCLAAQECAGRCLSRDEQLRSPKITHALGFFGERTGRPQAPYALEQEEASWTWSASW